MLVSVGSVYPLGVGVVMWSGLSGFIHGSVCFSIGSLAEILYGSSHWYWCVSSSCRPAPCIMVSPWGMSLVGGAVTEDRTEGFPVLKTDLLACFLLCL